MGPKDPRPLDVWLAKLIDLLGCKPGVDHSDCPEQIISPGPTTWLRSLKRDAPRAVVWIRLCGLGCSW